MDTEEREIILKQIMWDYNFNPQDIEDLFSGKQENVGHYNKYTLFKKFLESFPWFTILDFFTVNQIKDLLTDEVIKSLRFNSLRKQYEFIKQRLQETIPPSG
jgi:hypothetical protein